jgi:hypothetical protein
MRATPCCAGPDRVVVDDLDDGLHFEQRHNAMI